MHVWGGACASEAAVHMTATLGARAGAPRLPGKPATDYSVTRHRKSHRNVYAMGCSPSQEVHHCNHMQQQLLNEY